MCVYIYIYMVTHPMIYLSYLKLNTWFIYIYITSNRTCPRDPGFPLSEVLAWKMMNQLRFWNTGIKCIKHEEQAENTHHSSGFDLIKNDLTLIYRVSIILLVVQDFAGPSTVCKLANETLIYTLSIPISMMLESAALRKFPVPSSRPRWPTADPGRSKSSQPRKRIPRFTASGDHNPKDDRFRSQKCHYMVTLLG